MKVIKNIKYSYWIDKSLYGDTQLNYLKNGKVVYQIIYNKRIVKSNALILIQYIWKDDEFITTKVLKELDFDMSHSRSSENYLENKINELKNLAINFERKKIISKLV